MFKTLTDPVKKIKEGDVILFSTNTGAIFIGRYIGTRCSQLIIKHPAMIQTRPQQGKDGKTNMAMFFSLLLPDSAVVYKTRYSMFNYLSIIAIDKPLDDLLDTYSEYCEKVETGVFALSMSDDDKSLQDKFYEALCEYDPEPCTEPDDNAPIDFSDVYGGVDNMDSQE